MSAEITATSWGHRDTNFATYGSPGNHACLWDIATEQLVLEGFATPSAFQIQTKINDIVAFHNTQTAQPGFQPIANPNVIGDQQKIFMPPLGTTVPNGTKIAVGQEWRSPDGSTVLRVDAPPSGTTGPTRVNVYRNDGTAFVRVGGFDTAPGVRELEIGSDGKLSWTDPFGTRVWYGTQTGTNSRFVVQNDGNVVMYNGDNGVLWATNTQRKVA